MRPILEELYSGNIYPFEQILPQDPEYRPLNRKISDARQIWKEKLSEDDYRQLEELLNWQCQSVSMEATAAFIYGFKLGAMILMEVLTGKGELVRGGD
ncbi:MAG TPA: hypothetical protein PKA10_08010 [Selenomonadales bacterium]|nr:hypothetical protein [Selenomonadales bacterium]